MGAILLWLVLGKIVSGWDSDCISMRDVSSPILGMRVDLANDGQAHIMSASRSVSSSFEQYLKCFIITCFELSVDEILTPYPPVPFTTRAIQPNIHPYRCTIRLRLGKCARSGWHSVLRVQSRFRKKQARCMGGLNLVSIVLPLHTKRALLTSAYPDPSDISS